MSLIDRVLARAIEAGELTLVHADGRTVRFGAPDPGQPPVTIRFADAGVARAILTDPRLGAAEAYMDGRLLIEQGDIRDLIALFRRNSRWEKPGMLSRRGAKERVKRLVTRLDRLNWARRSQRNVAHHYDLDERLYRLFLDEDLQYSCAYFTDPANSLEQAQADKKAHIAAKLDLRAGQRVLDIGCGWGGMALYLNRVADVDVLGITLSEEQLRVARARAEAAGVADRVTFELIDYRALTGRFDRIVSVGMFEHVGPPHYRAFFRACHDLLAEDGVMLLHTIGRFGGPGTTDAFTAKYVFPGGYIPALSEIVAASERARLLMTDCETLRLHYGWTLRHWYDRTVAAREQIVALYDERFYRMWTFYLAGAETVFAYGGMGNYQLQYVRDRHALPVTRDYLAAAEADYRAAPGVDGAGAAMAGERAAAGIAQW